MFEAFSSAFEIDHELSQSAIQVSEALPKATGLEVFLQTFAGRSFNRGLYRVHTPQSMLQWNQLALKAFPELPKGIFCFGYDWLGRQFCLDPSRMESGEPLVVMLEPGTGDYFEIPTSFQQFHNEELVNHADAALANGFHADWLKASNQVPAHSQCVGYNHPLFLGGNDDIANLTLSDMRIYWDVMVQLICKTRDLPPGTPIGEIAFK